MEDGIDYSGLFGVTPEGGDGEPGQEDAPGGGEAERVPESDTQDAAGAPPDGAGPAGEDAAGQAPEPGALEQDGAARPDSQAAASPALDGGGRRPSREELAAQVRADAQRAIDEAFALSGMKNPYTGQMITSKAEYDAYKAQYDQERQEQVMRQTGMSREEFQQFVQDLPQVRQARQVQEAAEKAAREAREAAAKVKVDEQLREIAALDPQIKTLSDLAKMDTFPRLYELVARGNTLTDAFRLANFDALAQRRAAGVRQAAVNSVRSKEHLSETRTRGSGAVSVPADVREQYKLFNPDASEEEIQKHYARSVKPS